MDMVRAFIAIALPWPVSLWLEEVAGQLRPTLKHYRFARSAPRHLTLKFIGEISHELFDEVGQRLACGFEYGGAITLKPMGVGAFPTPARARVIWAGIGGETDQLVSLALEIEAALEPLGIGRDNRPFRPHLTLGRLIRGGRPQNVGNTVEKYKKLTGPSWTVAEVILYESLLKPEGAEHHQRGRAHL